MYGVVLVNKTTFERECIKVGIASGKDWRHVIKRARGFKGYDVYSEHITGRFTKYSCIEQTHRKFQRQVSA